MGEAATDTAGGDVAPGQDGSAPAADPPAGEAPLAGRNAEVNFHGQRRSNDTHASCADPEAAVSQGAGQEARLCFMGHALMENRSGLVVDA